MKTPIKSKNTFYSASAIDKIVPANSKISTALFFSGQIELELAFMGREVDITTNKWVIYEFWDCMVKNPYGSVGKDRTCDIWSGWTDMTSIQSAHLGKKMCKGQIGLYSLTVEKNGCDREMVVQSGLTDEYWTFSSTGSDKVLSTIVCITHR